jgi:quercetin dioxygenase-like cupin family protein
MFEEPMKPIRWEDVPLERINENVSRQVIWGENGTLARLCFVKGTHTSPHKHEAEQHTCVVDGVLEFRLDDEKLVLRAGDILVVPAWAEHEAWALEDTTVIDFFAPVRKDWLSQERGYN